MSNNDMSKLQMERRKDILIERGTYACIRPFAPYAATESYRQTCISRAAILR